MVNTKNIYIKCLYTMESDTFTYFFPSIKIKMLVTRKSENAFLGKLIKAREKAYGNAQLGDPLEK